ncbi:MAG: nucleotide-binding domain containing protein [Leisingera sp.]
MSGGGGTLIATGGGTMEAMLDRLGTWQFALVGELAPEFPLATATLPEGRSVTLGMKAGGFGDGATLLRAVDVLSSRKEKAI